MLFTNATIVRKDELLEIIEIVLNYLRTGETSLAYKLLKDIKEQLDY